MSKGRLKLAGIAASALALGMLAAPVQAQFGGILGGAVRGGANAATNTDSNGCPQGRRRSSGSRVLGGILGGAASGAAGSAGGVLSYVPVSDFTDQISTAIACKLDPDEQKQAADATLQATRSDTEEDAEVGDMVAWTSNTREDVSGTSTVTGRDRNNGRGNGQECITVSDVIIVRGEETRADKRMCRQPPARRYAIAEA